MIARLPLAVLFCWRLLVALSTPFHATDGSWNLLVAGHVAHGLVPYRDFSYGTTPLGLVVSAVFVRLLGQEAWVIRLVIEALFLGNLAFGVRILRQLGASRLVEIALLLACATIPADYGPYTTTASLFLLATLSSLLGARTAQPGPLPWLRVGLLAGLAFTAKQNLGLLSLAASLATLLGWERARPLGERAAALGRLVAGFAVPCAVLVAALAALGALPAFVDYAFVGKRHYLEHAGVHFLDGLSVQLAPQITSYFEVATWGIAPFVAGPLAIGALFGAIAAGRREERRWRACVLLFVGAAQGAVYPRADLAHLNYGLPTALLGLACLLPQLPRRLFRVAMTFWLGWSSAAVLVQSAATYDRYATTEAGWLPSLRGARFAPGVQLGLLHEATTLVALTAGEPLFILKPNAARYYLLTGLRNPTPFDYPLRTTFGSDGEQRLIQRIGAHRLSRVCLGNEVPARLLPAALITAVRERMYLRGEVAPCRLYRAWPPAEARGLTIELDLVASQNNQAVRIDWEDATATGAQSHFDIAVQRGPQQLRLRTLVRELREIKLRPCYNVGCSLRLTSLKLVNELDGDSLVIRPTDWVEPDMVEITVDGTSASFVATGKQPAVRVDPQLVERFAKHLSATWARDGAERHRDSD